MLFGTRGTPYKVAAHLCYATEATATAQWQKARRGGDKQQSKPPPTQADEAASQTPTAKPAGAAAEPAIAYAPAEPATRSVPAELATRCAEDRAWDTQALWESSLSHEL